MHEIYAFGNRPSITLQNYIEIYCDIAIYSDRDILRQYRNIAISQYNILQKLMHLATDHHYLAKIFSLARHKPFYLVKFHQNVLTKINKSIH